jgi:lauroyl/myristoyl acyltransferase
MLYLIRPMERHARRNLSTEIDRRRFDRAKRFVDPIGNREDAPGYRMHARWLKFLCGRPAVQRDVYPDDTAFLRRFAAAFGLSAEEERKFVRQGLLGRVWGVWCKQDLYMGPPAFVAQLTRVEGWEFFERSLHDGTGIILLPVHGQFSRLFQRCLLHRGYQGMELGLTQDKLQQRGFQTQTTKGLELARQMHAAKHLLRKGGIVFNLPDALQNLGNSRTVEFFGRQRRLAIGFAELALDTAAHLVPVAYRFTQRGFFVMEFRPPLQKLGQEAPREERVDFVLDQYANFLRDEWQRYPWNMQWNHLRHYLELPQRDNGDAGNMAAEEEKLAGIDAERYRAANEPADSGVQPAGARPG